MNARKLSVDERIRRAKKRTRKLVGHVATLFQMHEANAIVVYSPNLSQQIPRSHAAHAFNQFQRSMHLYEIVRLYALWDTPGTDRESIPTIIKLFDEPAIVERIAQEAHEYYAHEARGITPDSIDPHHVEAVKAWEHNDRSARAKEEEEHVRQQLALASSMAAKVRFSESLKSLKAFRNSYIAHNLALPDPDLAKEENALPVRYGDETALLETTVAVADALHRGLNGTSFDWNYSRQIARDNAAALWGNCRFQIPHR